MPIQQDQLQPLDTGVTFEDINNVKADRIIHNGSDIIKCEFHARSQTVGQQPRIIYYQTDGDKASSYTMEKPYILDLAYNQSANKYYTLRATLDNEAEILSSNFATDDFSNPATAINSSRWSYIGTGASGTLKVSDGKLRHKAPLIGGLNNPRLVSARAGSNGFNVAETSSTSGSIFYDFPYAAVSGIGLTGVSLGFRSASSLSQSTLYDVGVVSKGDTTLRDFRVAISGTESLTSNYSGRFTKVKVNAPAFIDLLTNPLTGGSGTYTVTVSGTPAGAWIITCPSHALSLSGTTFSGTADYAAGNKYLGFNFVSTITGFPDLSGEVVSMHIHYAAESTSSVSGTISAVRTNNGGGAYTYSSNLSTSYNSSYNLFNFYADDALEIDISTYSEQVELEVLTVDDFSITASSLVPAHLSNFSGLVTTQQQWMLNLEEVSAAGQVTQLILNRLNVLPAGLTYSGMTVSGAVQLAVNEGTKAYVKVFDDIYNVTLNPALYTPTGTNFGPGASGIAAVSGIVPEYGAYSFAYNDKRGEFLQYIQYDQNTSELRARTLSVSGGANPTASTAEVFLNVPDWQEQVASGSPYPIFLHGTDHNTLFYLRKHGSTGLNSLKSSGTNASVSGPTGSVTLTSSTANFLTSNVRPGDLVNLTSSAQRKVIQVVNATTIIMDGATQTGTNLTYSIYSNAELKQFNVDPTLSAFAAINVDDFSLRAGTSDTTTVRANVINCWGEPLQGKTVNFSVTQGDGAVNPASDTTDILGEAITDYNVGTTPGAVQITAVISD